MLSALCFVAVTCFDNVACLAFPAHVWFIDPSAPEEHTAYLGLNLISTVILILQYCSCVIQVFSSMSIWLLLAVACLEPFPQWPCQTAFCGSRAFDRRIDCMYLYFTEKKISSLLPEGLVAYQRPSRLLEREYVTLSSVSMDKKNVVSGFK